MIELVVVIVILAILSSLTVYSLGGTMDQYQLSRAAETIEIFDARARRDARTRQHPLQASIERSRGRLTISRIGTGDRTTFRLPSRVKIKQIRMRRQVTSGSRIDIDINSSGQSRTYAIQLERGKASRWLVVLGFSGQVIQLDTGREVDAIFWL